jgi:hypothetical protein
VSSAAHPEHPAGRDDGTVVLKCVRKSSLLELVQSRPAFASYHIVNDRSYQEPCVRCHEACLISEVVRSLVMGIRRVDTPVDGCIEVKHVDPLKVVIVCDVCMPAPLPDPKTVKRETNGGT